MIAVTGGAGFIGANFVHRWFGRRDEPVQVLDALTYAGSLDNLAGLDAARMRFERFDVADAQAWRDWLPRERPRAIVHFATESHVDRSIVDADAFLDTNVMGTYRLLEALREWPARPADFRLIHVSTDEVYGDLAAGAAPFREDDPFAPNNPYAASKAASEHLVRAWHRTHGIPAIVTHCGNNFGRFQYPEKLMPVVIAAALDGREIPVYGDGLQVRDWIHVDRHCDALMRILDHAAPGSVYNIGVRCERTNLDVVDAICAVIDRLRDVPRGTHRHQLRRVHDRAAHDRRYAIDPSRFEREIGWGDEAPVDFGSSIESTVQWYFERPDRLRHGR